MIHNDCKSFKFQKNMSDHFTRNIIKQILLRTMQNFGFQRVTNSSVEILTDVVISHLSKIAKEASLLTEHCGRTDTNGYDVFSALQRFHETPSSLLRYLKMPSIKRVQTYEFVVERYPVTFQTDYYVRQNATQRHPFRANMQFGDSVIPPFFPKPIPIISKEEMLSEVSKDNNKDTDNVENETKEKNLLQTAIQGIDGVGSLDTSGYELTMLVANCMNNKRYFEVMDVNKKTSKKNGESLEEKSIQQFEDDETTKSNEIMNIMRGNKTKTSNK